MWMWSHSCHSVQRVGPQKFPPLMFPDSDIAKLVTCGRTKVGYIVAFGLAHYYKEIITKDLQEVESYVAMFYESLNKVSQKLQMDIALRYWCPRADEVTTSYFSSTFLTKCKADDLVRNFNKQLESAQPQKKLFSLSIDGPNVNLKFVKDLTSLLKSSAAEDVFVHGRSKDE